MPDATYAARYFGVVGYTNGTTMDAPVAITKLGEQVMLPLTNWRQQITGGVCGSSTCPEVVFPVTWGWGPTYQSTRAAWFGSQLEGMQDESGYLYRRNRYFDPATGRFTQEDPIGFAGEMNLYGFGAGDPVNFSDPFGLCPKHAGGDGRTETAADCPREVLDSWAKNHVQLGRGASWDGVDATLRDAVIKASIDMNVDFYVSTTRNGTHATTSNHYQGFAVDVSRIDGLKFSLMSSERALPLARGVADRIVGHIPSSRRREQIGPNFANRFHRAPWFPAEAARLMRAHRDHVHVSILP